MTSQKNPILKESYIWTHPSMFLKEEEAKYFKWNLENLDFESAYLYEKVAIKITVWKPVKVTHKENFNVTDNWFLHGKLLIKKLHI